MKGKNQDWGKQSQKNIIAITIKQRNEREIGNQVYTKGLRVILKLGG